MKEKKRKLEIQIQDSITAFMAETKVLVDDIDIGRVWIHGGVDGVYEIRELFLSVKL